MLCTFQATVNKCMYEPVATYLHIQCVIKMCVLASDYNPDYVPVYVIR